LSEKALQVRKWTFSAGIAIGIVLGWFLEASFRSVVLSGILWGILVGAGGEGYIGNKTSLGDNVGAGFVLGFIAGIVAAFSLDIGAGLKLLSPFVGGLVGILLGIIGHVMGRIIGVSR